MNGYYFQLGRTLRKLSWTLALALGLSGSLLTYAATAQTPLRVTKQAQPEEKQAASEEDETPSEGVEIRPEPLTWARVDFIRNRVLLVPQDESGRRANIADILRLGDALRTARASRAELRFNDGSLARVGERATFRFTPNTRNFQLSNGTILLLIPPGRGRSTIQTPNAVTGIQGSALFVRYIPETDTTIVGALTDNPDGPMVLFNRDGSEQQALRANEIGVIEGDQITELYQFDGTLFWQSSGLAEGFNYLSESTSTDELDGVRREIRDAITTQGRISGDSVITNPEAFKAPATELNDDIDDINVDTEEPEIEFQGSPAQEYESSVDPVDERSLEVGINNKLEPAAEPRVAAGEGGPPVSESDTAAVDNSGEEDTEISASSDSGDSGTLGTSSSGAQGTATDSGTDVSDTGATDTLAGGDSSSALDSDSVNSESGSFGSVQPSDASPSTPSGGLGTTTRDATTPTGSPSVVPGSTEGNGTAVDSPATSIQPVQSDTTFSDSIPAQDIPTPTEEVTVPGDNDLTNSIGETSILQPVPDQIDKLDEVQSVHDAEMHGVDDGMSELAPGNVSPGDADPGTANSGGVDPGNANPGSVNPGGANPGGANPGGVNSGSSN